MARKAKIDYDEEHDVLWVYTGEKIKDSLEIDDFVVDFSHEDKVVGVEIFNASKVISGMALSKISRETLAATKGAVLSFYQGREFFYIVVGLFVVIDQKEREVSVQVPAPMVAVTA